MLRKSLGAVRLAAVCYFVLETVITLWRYILTPILSGSPDRRMLAVNIASVAASLLMTFCYIVAGRGIRTDKIRIAAFVLHMVAALCVWIPNVYESYIACHDAAQGVTAAAAMLLNCAASVALYVLLYLRLPALVSAAAPEAGERALRFAVASDGGQNGYDYSPRQEPADPARDDYAALLRDGFDVPARGDPAAPAGDGSDASARVDYGDPFRDGYDGPVQEGFADPFRIGYDDPSPEEYSAPVRGGFEVTGQEDDMGPVRGGFEVTGQEDDMGPVRDGFDFSAGQYETTSSPRDDDEAEPSEDPSPQEGYEDPAPMDDVPIFTEDIPLFSDDWKDPSEEEITVEELNKYRQLFEIGMITWEEYAAMKDKLAR